MKSPPKSVPLNTLGSLSENRATNLFQNIKSQDLCRQARAVTRRLAYGKSMATCGTYPIPQLLDENKLNVHLGIYEKSAHFHGLAHCNNQFCPTCMTKTKPERIERIESGLRAAMEYGFKAYFLTLTTPRTGDPIAQVEHLLHGFRYLQDKVKYRLKKMGASLDFVKNLDVTFKLFQEDIYHTHLHIILVVRGDFEEYTDSKRRSFDEVDKMGLSSVELTRTVKGKVYPKYSDGKNYRMSVDSFEEMVQLSWHDVMKTKDIDVSLDAQHIEEVHRDSGLSRYVAKFEGLGMELANFQHKSGKNNKGKLVNKYGSIGYMQLLGFAARGLRKAEDVVYTFLQAVHGRRTMDFSRNWKELEEMASIPEKELLELFDCDGESTEETTNELLYEVKVPISWFNLFKTSEIEWGDGLHSVLFIFPIAAYKAYHLGRIDVVEQLLDCDPHLESSGYALGQFLLKYWEPIALSRDVRKLDDVSRIKDTN